MAVTDCINGLHAARHASRMHPASIADHIVEALVNDHADISRYVGRSPELTRLATDRFLAEARAVGSCRCPSADTVEAIVSAVQVRCLLRAHG